MERASSRHSGGAVDRGRRGARRSVNGADTRTRPAPEFAADAEASAWSPPMEVVDARLVTGRRARTWDSAAAGTRSPRRRWRGTDQPAAGPRDRMHRHAAAGQAARRRRARGGIACAARQAPALVRPHRARLAVARCAAIRRGEFVEFAACLLLADRNGAASHAQLDTFVRVMSELAPDAAGGDVGTRRRGGNGRAEALDRLCADVDVQVGLTVLKQEPRAFRARGCAAWPRRPGSGSPPAAASSGVQEDTGAVLYTLQNVRNEPFTRRYTAPVGNQWRRAGARRTARRRSSARVRPDEARGEAHGTHAGRRTGRRQPPAARRRGAGAIRQQVQGAADALAGHAASSREARGRSRCSAPDGGRRCRRAALRSRRRARRSGVDALRREIEAHNHRYYVLDAPTHQRRRIRRAVPRAAGARGARIRRWSSPDSPTQRVGGAPAGEFAPVTHRVPMLSLRTNAFTDAEARGIRPRACARARCAGAPPVEYAAELKFDGLAISLPYERGVFAVARTRGDGETRRGRHRQPAHDRLDSAEALADKRAAACSRCAARST